MISHTGIDFDVGKEDKFIYLRGVVELIIALDHPYLDSKTYQHKLDKQMNNQDVEVYLRDRCPDFEAMIDKSNHNIEDEIAHNIKRAEENRILNPEEKDVLEKNIKLMENYMLQRSVNKRVYYCALNILAEIVKKDHIDHIQIKLEQNYFHILHSLQGVLEKQKAPVDTKLEVFEHLKELYVSLQVITLVSDDFSL